MYYLLMSLISLISCVIFYLLKSPVIKDRNQESVPILDRLQTSPNAEEMNVMRDVKNTAKMLIDKKMLRIAP